MKNIIQLSLGVAALLFAGCSSETDEIQEEIASKGVVMSISDFTWDDGTRISLEETPTGLSFKWKSGDQVSVYTYSTAMANFDVETISEDAMTATFNGGGFHLERGSNYYALYPYVSENTDKTAISVNYTGQNQISNNSTEHLGSFDYMTASAVATAYDVANFNFQHVSVIMRFILKAPVAGTYKSLRVSTQNALFATAGTIDVTNESPSLTATETSRDISLNLGTEGSGITLNESNLELISWVIGAPADLSSEALTIQLTDNNDNVYTYYAAGRNMVKGKAYSYDCQLSSLTFSADTEQTLSLSSAVSGLEYSVGGGSWNELGADPISFGGINGNLYLRGQNTSGTAISVSDYSSIMFGNETPVKCSGDIRNLIDYTNPFEVPTDNARFCFLFKDCSVLTSVPELPITDLATDCYYGMFDGCTALTNGPALDAEVLAEGCYSHMFEGCISLTESPLLNSSSLKKNCYNSMFIGCTALSVAPALPATTLAEGCYEKMFAGCTGLTTSPILPAKNLASSAYKQMFYGCTNLTKINMFATNISSASDCTSNWVNGVAENGIFIKSISAVWNDVSVNGIPEGWTILYYNSDSGKYYKDAAGSLECNEDGSVFLKDEDIIAPSYGDDNVW